MVKGNEYGSIVSLVPSASLDLVGEVQKARQAVEQVRGRPCLAYVGNVVKGGDLAGIDSTDDLPFAELVASVPADQTAVDVILVTNGGSGHQVSRFVNALRGRFDHVAFLLPSFCMSAGTLFALSGDEIWMTARACMGPIDPQVPSKDGRFVPAQALLLLVEKLQADGEKGMADGTGVPWTAVRLIDSIDKKELGDAISASKYSTMMATEFLKTHKFKSWEKHNSTGADVTDGEKEESAIEIAEALASHNRWKNHGHAIARDVLWSEVKLKVDHPDTELGPVNTNG